MAILLPFFTAATLYAMATVLLFASLSADSGAVDCGRDQICVKRAFRNPTISSPSPAHEAGMEDALAKTSLEALMTYANLEIGTLYIGMPSIDIRFEWVFEVLALRDVRTLCMGEVKHFAFAVAYWRYFGTESSHRILSSFTNLESLALVVEDDISPDAPVKLVDLDEEELSQETEGWGYSDGEQDGQIIYLDVSVSIQTAYTSVELSISRSYPCRSYG